MAVDKFCQWNIVFYQDDQMSLKEIVSHDYINNMTSPTVKDDLIFIIWSDFLINKEKQKEIRQFIERII